MPENVQVTEGTNCPVQARKIESAMPRDARGRPMAFRPAQAATVEESRIPLLVLLTFVLLSLALLSLQVETAYARARAFQKFPEVRVASRDLVDECGVFMWVRWTGPGFDSDAPYIPMKFRYGE